MHVKDRTFVNLILGKKTFLAVLMGKPPFIAGSDWSWV